MEAMHQNWTDDRMDELAERMEAGFAQARVDLASTREELRREIRAQGAELRREIKGQSVELRSEMAGLRNDVTTRLDSMNEILASGQRMMILFSGGLCAALIAALGALVAATL